MGERLIRFWARSDENSMATDSSHRVIMEKTFLFFSGVFRPILFVLADNDDMHGS